MALIEGIKIDGSLIKDTLGGIGDLFSSIREAITGEPSPQKRMEALDKLAQAEQTIIMAQNQVNTVEAANPNVFVSGWRPAVGWVCAISLGTYYIPQAALASILWFSQCVAVMLAAPDITKVVLPGFPQIFDVKEIMGLVASMLGLAGFRSLDKVKGVASK